MTGLVITEFIYLERFAVLHPRIKPDDFMFIMNHHEVHLFKHHMTRRYLNIDDNLNTFQYFGTSGTYAGINPLIAVDHVLR